MPATRTLPPKPGTRPRKKLNYGVIDTSPAGKRWAERGAVQSAAIMEREIARRDQTPVQGSATLRAAMQRHGIPTDGIGTVPEAYDPEQRAFMRYCATGDREQRDMQVGAFGAIIPATWQREILWQVQASGALLGRVRVITPGNGRPLTFPIMDDTANSGTVYTEGVALTTTDPVLGNLSFPQVQEWSAPGLFRASRQLVQDSGAVGYDLIGLLTEMFAWRILRAAESYATAQLIAAATNNVTTGANTGATYADWVSLVSELDPAYASSSNSCILVSRNSLKAMRLLEDDQHRPLISADNYTVTTTTEANQFGGTEERTYRVPSILGLPVLTSRYINDFSAGGGVFALVGAWDKAYVFRFVGAEVVVLHERYADFGEVGATGLARFDGLPALQAAYATMTAHA